MKKFSLPIITLVIVAAGFIHVNGQASAPFTTCPGVTLAIARTGTNTYNNDPVFIYNVDPSSGVATAISGGPLHDPANPSNNFDMNAVGLNAADGYLYGINPESLNFYRFGSNYSIEEIGKLAFSGPPLTGSDNISVVSPAAGEFDQSGNYYFTAFTGIFSFPNTTFDNFYIGKISNVAGLPASTNALSAAYTKMNFAGASCSDFLSTLTATNDGNTGIKDIAFNPKDGMLYSYVTFEFPIGSGTYEGQLFSIDPLTGNIICFPETVLSFANTHNEISGVAITNSGALEILFTTGSLYKDVSATPFVYSGNITLVNPSTIAGGSIRADMASCTAADQVLTPFTNCPGATLAIARTGTNTYNNDPVFIYNVDALSGAANTVSGGPLHDPADPSNNFDMNAVGLNAADGYLYGINPESLNFYRFGSNYNIQEIGMLAFSGPPLSGSDNISVVSPAAGEFDQLGNYYFTAFTGIFSFPNTTFDNFYIGKISGVAGLPASTNALSPAYTKMNFSGASCSDFFSTLTATNDGNTGIKDIAFNPKDGMLYSYVTFEFPIGSGIYEGQLFSINTSTGNVTCFPETVLSFANTHNEISGVAITNSGALEILFTTGSLYKDVSTTPFAYSGNITLINASAIAGGSIRADMASCTAIILPVVFKDFFATENNCVINFTWDILEEQNTDHYELELQNTSGVFEKKASIKAVNNGLPQTYLSQLPADGKNIIARIKVVDKDGSTMYSNTINVVNSCNSVSDMIIVNSVQIGDQLVVKWDNIKNAEQYHINIFNSYGSTMISKNISVNAGASTNNIDVFNLTAGAYILVAQNNNGVKFIAKFIKR